MPAEPAHGHRETAQFDDDVCALRKLRDVPAPQCKHFLAIASVRANAQGPANMVEHNSDFGKCPGEVGKLRYLRVV